MMDIAQYIFICFLPYLLLRLSRLSKLESILSPVVLCYGVGLAIGNFFPDLISSSITGILTQATIALAIPMILMTSDFKAFLNGTRNILLSFFIAISVVFLMCVLGAFIFNEQTEHAADVAAMLAGVYTGGTPNMSSIKMAINADQNIFGILNIADIIMSGAYLIFLTSIGPVFFRKILPAFKLENKEDGRPEIEEIKNEWQGFSFIEKIKNLIVPILLAISVVVISVGISYLIFQEIKEALFIILITILGTSISFFSFSKKIKGAYEAGDYLLLIFSLSLGILSDFSAIKDSSFGILMFTGFVLFGAIFLHLLLSRIFKIDADTVMVTSAACIFGPVFIGQIVSVMKNKSMLVPGMAMGVMGYAIGSFLGIFIHYLLS